MTRTMVLPLVAVLVAGQLSKPELPAVEVITLRNGMRWVLLPRPDEGLVSGLVTVRAGGVHETEGLTGAAHLLEHLAFAGTPMIGSRSWRLEAPLQERTFELIDAHAKLARQGQGHSPQAMQLATELVAAERDWAQQGDPEAFPRLLVSNDAMINASTSKDATRYWADFPREQLHLWLAAEAQRLAAPVFRDFRTQRDVVVQEWVDSQGPLSVGSEALYALAFEGTGYAWTTVGRIDDLRTMSPRDVERFYEAHYAPSNAVGCLVGEFDPKEAKAWLEQTFALVPDRAIVPHRPVAPSRPRALVRKAEEGWLLLGFDTPSLYDPGSPAFELAQRLLTLEGGVLDELCTTTGPCSSFAVTPGPGLADRHLTSIVLRLRKGHAASEAREAFFRALRAWAPDEGALTRARVSLELQRRGDLRTRKDVAESLSAALLFGADWRQVYQARHKAITAAQVQAVLETFTPERAWTVQLEAP